MTDDGPDGGAPAGTGQVLSGGHYRLGVPLTPAVWSARDEWEGREVLAVALAPAGGEGALARVARDVRRAGEHPHPGLAPARDVAAGTDRTLWLVHDAPAGVRGLADAGAVPARVLLRRALVLAGALEAAHAARLVHGRVGADVVLVGDGPEDVRLLGAASGVRPADRPAAEDDDTRALAGALAAVPLTDAGSDLATRLLAVLARCAAPGEEPAGGLDARLRGDLRALTGAEPGRAPEPAVAGPAERPTERVDLPVGGAPLVATGSPAVRTAPAAPARPYRPVPPPRPPAPRGPGRPALHGPPPPVPPRPGPTGPPGPPPPPGRPRTRSLVLLAAGAVVLLLAGVVAVVATQIPRGTDPAAPQDRVVPAALGDPRTVDPCGLVDPAALGRAAGGPARLVPDLGSPAACTADVTGRGGDLVLVATLERVATTVTAGEEQRVGPLLVRRAPPRPGVCTRTVVTTEGMQVALDAVVPAGSGVDPCPVADAATDGAVAALSRGTTLPRRAVEDPPGALTGVDACGLLTPDDLATVPGLDPARVVPGVAGWSCRWGSGEGRGSVTVGVTRRRAVAPAEEVAGRAAVVSPGAGSCTTGLVQRALTAPDGGPRVELLEVTVFGGGPVAALCDGSRTLAAATGPRLPPP